MLFLITAMTAGGNFCKPATGDGGLPAVNFLEKWLIGEALCKNIDVKNVQNTRFFSETCTCLEFSIRKKASQQLPRKNFLMQFIETKSNLAFYPRPTENERL